MPPAPDTVSERFRAGRKRWWILLPAVFVTYSLAYLDRANFGFGAAAGMAGTLHRSDKDISLLGSVFFLGYLLFQVPGAALARRFGITRIMFLLLIVWGACATLTGVIHTFWLLVIDRLLLGAAESLIFPALMLLLTNWFTRAERSRANAFLIMGNPVTVLWMSLITGYLIQGLGWQKTFVAEGLPAVFWSAVWILLVRDRPSDAHWISAGEAARVEREIAAEQVGLAPVAAVRQAFVRADVLLLTVQYFFWSIGVYGFVLWLPTIVKQGAALSMGKTGLLSAVPYVAAVVLMIVVATVSDRTQSRRAIVWPFLLVAGLALFGSFVLAPRSFWLAFAFLVVGGGCMYAPYGPFFAIVPERLPRNVTGEVIALINSSGALGGFAGSYCVGFLQSATGNSRAGFLLMSISLILSSLLILCLPAKQGAMLREH